MAKGYRQRDYAPAKVEQTSFELLRERCDHAVRCDRPVSEHASPAAPNFHERRRRTPQRRLDHATCGRARVHIPTVANVDPDVRYAISAAEREQIARTQPGGVLRNVVAN